MTKTAVASAPRQPDRRAECPEPVADAAGPGTVYRSGQPPVIYRQLMQEWRDLMGIRSTLFI